MASPKGAVGVIEKATSSRLSLLSFALAALMLGALVSAGRGQAQEGLLPAAILTIVMPASAWDDAALSLAARDLSAALADIYRLPVIVVDETALQRPPAYAFVLSYEPDGSSEAYALRSLESEGGPTVSVAGGSALGAAFGVFRLIERLRLAPGLLRSSFQIEAATAMSLRLVSDPLDPDYPSPEQALRWGFNAIAVQPWPHLALYDRVDGAIYDPGRYPSQRAWVEERRRRAEERIARAKALHLQVISPGDALSFPGQVMELYGAEVVEGADPPHFCIQRPATSRLMAAALDEVLTDFPAIDAVMVRTGENYPAGPITGSRPGECGAEAWQDVRSIIDTVSEVALKRHGKTYIQRAWDLGPSGFHANPAVAARILAGREPDPRFIVSFKQTQTDFWRYNSLNPNLGQGSAAQMIEFQAAREYEGKGAFPNYLGAIYAEGDPLSPAPGGLRQAYEGGVRAVWVWVKGGGWDGPYPARDLWVDANVYALRRLAWDLSADPGTLAHEWATLNFGPKAARYIARVLEPSADPTVKVFYSGPAARRLGHSWAPNELWVRDDVVYGTGPLAALYARSRDDASFGQALAEKEEALALVDEMLQDVAKARRAGGSEDALAFAEGTLLYERALVEALRDYFTGMFHYFRWREAGAETDRQQALAFLRAWEASWPDYEEKAERLAIATPYKDRGMGQAVADALADMSR